jgi:hypothetical protein
VAGGDQHQRHDVDGAVTGLDEAVHGVLDGRWRQLEEAARDVRVRRAQLGALDERGELGAAGGALRAVADDEQGGTGRGRRSRSLLVEQGVQGGSGDGGAALLAALDTAGQPLSRRAALDSAAPTKPTGRPTTSAGAAPERDRARTARSARSRPTHTAPGPTSSKAIRTAAALRVRPARGPGARGRRHTTGRLVMPGGDHLHVGDDGRTGGERVVPPPQRGLVGDQVVDVGQVGAGVHHPLHDGAG